VQDIISLEHTINLTNSRQKQKCDSQMIVALSRHYQPTMSFLVHNKFLYST